MVEVSIRYEGDLRCSAVHGPSGAKILTDAPVDNMGKGEAFSPTDLVATALGTCILTTMAIIAKRHNFDFAGASIKVGKEMTQTPPRKIARLPISIHIPGNYTEEQKQRLINAAAACPVHRSLDHSIEIPMTWSWE